MAAVEISICILTYNSADTIVSCIKSALTETVGYQAEIIVVDNNSSDDTCEIIDRNFPSVQLIRNSSNKGFAKGINKAIRNSSGRYILALNPDAKLMNGALSGMIHCMREKKDAAAVSASLYDESQQLQPYVSVDLNLFNAFLAAANIGGLVKIIDPQQKTLSVLKPFRKLLGKTIGSYVASTVAPAAASGHSREVLHVNGTCVLLDRQAVDDVGLFDERFFLYVEDADWSRRCREHGWRLYVCEAAGAIHLSQWSFKRKFGSTSPIRFYALVEYALKYNGALNALLTRIAIACGFVLRAIWASLLALCLKSFRTEYRGMVKDLLSAAVEALFYHPIFSQLLFHGDKELVAIDGLFGLHDLGDDLTLRSILKAHEHTNKAFLVFSADPERISRIHGVTSFPHRPMNALRLLYSLFLPGFWVWLARSLLLIKRSSLLITAEGSSFQNGSSRVHIDRLFKPFLASFLKCKCVAFSAGRGSSKF